MLTAHLLIKIMGRGRGQELSVPCVSTYLNLQQVQRGWGFPCDLWLPDGIMGSDHMRNLRPPLKLAYVCVQTDIDWNHDIPANHL